MASYAICLCFFFLLAFSFSLQTQARDGKFFSKISHSSTKTSKENPDSISISPSQSPALAPESQVVEHGYGLYGSESYQYSPTTADSVKTTLVGAHKFVPAKELNNHNFEEFEMGLSNTIVNEKSHFNDNNNHDNNNQNVNQHFESERQGMSDRGFFENGKYNHDIKSENGYINNNDYYNINDNLENVGWLNENGYANGYNEKENHNGNYEYVTQGRGEYDDNNAKKLPPNEYNTMEEYEKEQEYRESQFEYVP